MTDDDVIGSHVSRLLRCPHCEHDLWFRLDATAMFGPVDPRYGMRPADPSPYPRLRLFRRSPK